MLNSRGKNGILYGSVYERDALTIWNFWASLICHLTLKKTMFEALLEAFIVPMDVVFDVTVYT